MTGDYGLAEMVGANTSAVKGLVESVELPHGHGAATPLTSLLYNLGAATAGGQCTTGATAGGLWPRHNIGSTWRHTAGLV